jgi:hypothetical protein
MTSIGRNDPCPCGSGKKFKKCHMGREDELLLDEFKEPSPEEMGEKIVKLSQVGYNRSQELTGALDLQMLTGISMGIKWVDLDDYLSLNLSGGVHSRRPRGAVLINIHKTLKADPHTLYIAISKDVDEATLVHQLAHVLDFLGGSKLLPGTMEPLAYELGIPVEHLEHPEEFGRWLEFLVKRFEVRLDADDSIISYLYQHQLLIKGREIHDKNVFILKAKSDRILQYLSNHSEEVNSLIRDLPGYIGSRTLDP